jgi:dipeptidyl aminopeptidase/acylaminoacyl peptidase
MKTTCTGLAGLSLVIVASLCAGEPANAGATKSDTVVQQPSGAPETGQTTVTQANALKSEHWFAEARYVDTAFNEDGDLLASVVRGDSERLIRVYDSRALTGFEIPFTLNGGYLPLGTTWVGRNHLAIRLRHVTRNTHHLIVQVERAENGKPTLGQQFWIDHPGEIVDPLPHREQEVLFLSHMVSGGKLTRGVWRLDYTSDLKTQLRPSAHLGRGVRNAIEWFPDGRGNLAAVLTFEQIKSKDPTEEGDGEIEFRLMLPGKRKGGWEPSRVLGEIEGRTVLGIDAAATTLYLTDEEEGSRASLYALDLASGEERSLLSILSGDILAIEWNGDRTQVLGVTYIDEGSVRHHYFDNHVATSVERIAAALPDRNVRVIAADSMFSRVLAIASHPQHPPTLHTYNAATGEVRLFGIVYPDLMGVNLAPVLRFEFRNEHGMVIEAMLTMRGVDGASKLPLVVMPHGGPMGVRDLIRFDRQVQYLAAHGMAVLQVNYRGSAGQGKAFLEAGKRQWGRGIENDIEAAVDHALGIYPLDPDRICAAGASYGGYSALMLMIRNAKRYKCAVALAAPTDLRLMFHSSDWSADEDLAALMKQWVGDPTEHLEELMEFSPLYRHRELTNPVLLAHGMQDRRVDVEHSRRLARILEVTGRTPEVVAFPTEGHALSDLRAVRQFQDTQVRFLVRHLGLESRAGVD